ncbi:MAG TPA: TIR domain-containing protein, partial [Armatimonadota bacterium]
MSRNNLQHPFSACTREQPYIFVSYAHADSEAVFADLATLHADGLPLWYDEGIEAGSSWSEAVAGALAEAAGVLVFLSEAAVRSPHVRNEITFALDRRKPLLVIYLEDVTLPPGLALRLGDIQALVKWRLPVEQYQRKLLPQLQRILGQSAAPAASPVPPEAPSHHLPAPTTSFVGREGELTAVGALLQGARLVTLVGAGGVGKTRLALQVAGELEGFRDGVWLVELAALTDPALVAQTVAQALRTAVPSERTAQETLTADLADKELLLVLDNCEHLLEGCAALVAALLRACPKLRILATSRE